MKGDDAPAICFLRIGVFMVDVFDKLLAEIKGGTRTVSLSGMTSVSSKAFVLAKLRAETGKTFAVVTESNTSLEEWNSDLDFFSSEISDLRSQIIVLPSFEADP